MAVRAMTGADEDFIWHKMPLAVGLQYHAQWWKRENDVRQRMSFGKVQEIFVLMPSVLTAKKDQGMIV